ncbi:hypothetical protein [Thalassospira tepidiphila]|uniref:hypothetical protein n=1 Tax=Thalassospira tepidiphila TaxID=393657 RepID=UPI0030C6E87C
MVELVFASRDPGSANMLAALFWMLGQNEDMVDIALERFVRAIDGYSLEELRQSNKRVIAWGAAEQVWRREGVEGFDIFSAGALEAHITREQVSKIFDQHRKQILITGLDDVDAITVRLMWEEARARGIPIIILADNDKNIAARLRDSKTNIFLPDKLLAPSPACIEDIQRSGLDIGFAELCTNLHLFRMKLSPASFVDCRNNWGAASDETVVLFVSLVGREMVGLGRPVLFDEVVLLENVIASLEHGRLEEDLGPKVSKPRLIVRPHPREDLAKFDWLNQYQGSFPIVLSGAGSPTDAIMSADIIVGIQCAMLEEAQVRGQSVHFLSTNGIT